MTPGSRGRTCVGTTRDSGPGRTWTRGSDRAPRSKGLESLRSKSHVLTDPVYLVSRARRTSPTGSTGTGHPQRHRGRDPPPQSVPGASAGSTTHGKPEGGDGARKEVSLGSGPKSVKEIHRYLVNLQLDFASKTKSSRSHLGSKT